MPIRRSSHAAIAAPRRLCPSAARGFADPVLNFASPRNPLPGRLLSRPRRIAAG